MKIDQFINIFKLLFGVTNEEAKSMCIKCYCHSTCDLFDGYTQDDFIDLMVSGYDPINLDDVSAAIDSMPQDDIRDMIIKWAKSEMATNVTSAMSKVISESTPPSIYAVSYSCIAGNQIIGNLLSRNCFHTVGENKDELINLALDELRQTMSSIRYSETMIDIVGKYVNLGGHVVGVFVDKDYAIHGVLAIKT
jgi:hypothetical protein